MQNTKYNIFYINIFSVSDASSNNSLLQTCPKFTRALHNPTENAIPPQPSIRIRESQSSCQYSRVDGSAEVQLELSQRKTCIGLPGPACPRLPPGSWGSISASRSPPSLRLVRGKWLKAMFNTSLAQLVFFFFSLPSDPEQCERWVSHHWLQARRESYISTFKAVLLWLLALHPRMLNNAAIKKKREKWPPPPPHHACLEKGKRERKQRKRYFLRSGKGNTEHFL